MLSAFIGERKSLEFYFSALFSLKRPEFPQLVMAHIWFSLSTSTLAIKPFAFLNSYCSKWLVIVLYLNIPCPTVVNHRFFVFIFDNMVRICFNMDILGGGQYKRHYIFCFVIIDIYASSVPIHILLRVLYKDEIASLAPLSFSL